MTNWLLPAKHNWTADSFADKAMPSSAEVNALMDELLNPNCPDMNQVKGGRLLQLHLATSVARASSLHPRNGRQDARFPASARRTTALAV